MTPPHPDVVVVGAGAVGAAAAYELALAGADVHLIDQGTQPATGCSRANAGLIAPSHAEPLTGAANIRTGLTRLLRADSAFRIRPTPRLMPWLARYAAASKPARVDAATRTLRDLGAASLGRHTAYRDRGLDTSFQQNGLLDVFATQESRDKAITSLTRNPLELHYEVLRDADVRGYAPNIASTAGGILFQHEAHCDSRLFVEGVLAAAQQQGARITLGTRVRELAHDKGRIRGVHTSDGVVAASNVVLATGHLSSELTRPLGIRMPLAPAKGYVIDLESRPDDPQLPVGLKQDLVVVTPYHDRIRLAGTLELTGNNRSVDSARTQAIRTAAERTFPSLRHRDTLSVWTGLRPCSADGLPIVGPVDTVEGLTLATGHGQQGLVLAPATGQIVAAQLSGTPPPVDASVITALTPTRF